MFVALHSIQFHPEKRYERVLAKGGSPPEGQSILIGFEFVEAV
jgi:hypothetical protein